MGDAETGLPFDVSLFDAKTSPPMDRTQVGSLRHIGNLARRLPRDWSDMEGLSDDFGGLRFQLAYMTYALALTHFHRLPAAPGVFRSTFEKLIEKMLHPDVWFGWRDISKGGGIHNAKAPMTEGWVDPIVKNNIMYSAYLQNMALFYNVLFNDDRYAKPGALTLQHVPLGWGGGKGWTFEYDQNSITERIYWNLVQNGYLGVACEPYCVFQICNQPMIIGFRLHDVLTGGDRAEEVTQGYLKAWDEFGGVLDERGHYNMLIETYTKTRIPSVDTSSDAWCASLMHAWNPQFVTQHYVRQRDAWLLREGDGMMVVKGPDKSKSSLISSGSLSSLAWLAVWAAEMGDTATLNGLLSHVDRYMQPEWRDGGFHYLRQDSDFDENGRLVAMQPIQSNALFPYARLNVPNGLRLLYSRPWGPEHHAEPALVDVDFALDVTRAVYISETSTLRFDVARSSEHEPGSVVISDVFARGEWILRREGNAVAQGDRNGFKVMESGLANCLSRDESRLRLVVHDTRSASYDLIWMG